MAATGNPVPPEEGAPLKPYLIRAIHQWAVDHHLTPQVLVDAGVEEVAVPMNKVRDGRIALNLHPQSVAGLELGNHYLLFSARFGGQAFEVCLPMAAIMAIYCRENGQGIVFQSDIGAAAAVTGADPAPPKRKRPPGAHLRLVK